MSRQASMSEEDESQMQTKMYDVIFFKFIYKVIGLHWTDGVSVQLSSAPVPIAYILILILMVM